MSNLARNASSNSGAGAPPVYTCPMHPEVAQNGPGRCPKCGMALEPNTAVFHSMKRPAYGLGLPRSLALCGVLVVAAFFLWQDHRAHLFGALPYVLLLLCPIMHLFMHRGHDHSGSSHSESHR